MSDETIELLPCPLCGSDWIEMFIDDCESWVACQECHVIVDINGATEEQLAAAWNRRTPAAAPGEAELYARLEKLAKAIMRRPAPYSDELGRKHYELAHDTLKILRARRPYEGE